VALFDAPVAPVPPLGVRRTTPEHQGRARGGSDQKLGPLDRDLLEGLQRIEHAEQRQAAAEARKVNSGPRVDPARRVGAAAIDAGLLGTVALGIIAMTLRWSDLAWDQVSLLPAPPLTGLVLMIVVGYLFMFTAATGQTAGKMLVGLRVVDAASEGGRVSVRQALSRSALTVPSILLLGAGFVPALIGDGRAIHDRMAQTRVVRA
jgi:uncharacterized RDD family membrane protein YckC